MIVVDIVILTIIIVITVIVSYYSNHHSPFSSFGEYQVMKNKSQKKLEGLLWDVGRELMRIKGSLYTTSISSLSTFSLCNCSCGSHNFIEVHLYKLRGTKLKTNKI
jgi:hypothetical protein